MKYLIALALLSSAAFAKDKEVMVQGSCDIKVVPDRGSVTFTAENQAKDQKEAVDETNQQIEKLKAKLQKLKLAHLEFKNTAYNVYPVREYEKDKVVDKGTRVSLSLEVTTSEITRLGEAMVEASKLNIQNVGTMMSFLSLEKTQSEYLKCLDVAADDARKKAEQLGKKFGFKVGEVLKIMESPTQGNPQPIYPNRAFMAKSMRGGADMETAAIEPGTQNFSTTLQVSFAIK